MHNPESEAHYREAFAAERYNKNRSRSHPHNSIRSQAEARVRSKIEYQRVLKDVNVGTRRSS